MNLVMGYDIQIVDFEIKNRDEKYIITGEQTCRDVSLYFSLWTDLKHIYYVKDDMIGYKGEVVAKNIEKALKKLDDMNIQPKTFTHPDWSYGVDMSHDDRLSVMRFHLETFLKYAKQYSEHYFISLAQYDVIKIDDKIYENVEENTYELDETHFDIIKLYYP